MADIFGQYGIKEVADVSIYKIDKDENETPFLFLDTLKVSTIEQTAEQTDARGGKGNPKLITWDYGKEINITLEDALYSPRSMALMFGSKTDWATQTFVTKMIRAKGNAIVSGQIKDGQGKMWTVQGYIDPVSGSYTGVLPPTTGDKVYQLEVSASVKTGKKLSINADDFPGTYKIVGDTYARNRDSGEDEYFQFIIPRCKLSADQTLTLEAEGDPSTFNLNATVLRPTTGAMIELVQYELTAPTTAVEDTE